MSKFVTLCGFRGPSGAELNFEIVGGSTIPNNPTENMIWIQTDDEENIVIENWIFSATEPKVPTDNMVWISIGTSSTGEFNALKKNGIHVYPLFAKKYVSGTWVDKTVKSYQGGVWDDWIVYLFKDGNEYESITGGWGTVYTSFTLGTINSAGNLYMAGWKKTFATEVPISKGTFKTICFEVVNVKQNSADHSAYITLSNVVFNGSNSVALVAPSSAGTVKIPLDNVASEFYITLYSYWEDEILEISEIWLE